MKYWFRPARFWKWCAFYYPVSKEGWIATTTLFLLGGKIFLMIDSHSHSVSDTLIGFAPWFIALACIFDLLCFRRGLYPAWWKRHHNK